MRQPQGTDGGGSPGPSLRLQSWELRDSVLSQDSVGAGIGWVKSREALGNWAQ